MSATVSLSRGCDYEGGGTNIDGDPANKANMIISLSLYVYVYIYIYIYLDIER